MTAFNIRECVKAYNCHENV